jgi:hypothetical protein
MNGKVQYELESLANMFFENFLDTGIENSRLII